MNIALRINKQPNLINIYVDNIYCGMIHYHCYNLKSINDDNYKYYIEIDTSIIMRCNELTIIE